MLFFIFFLLNRPWYIFKLVLLGRLIDFKCSESDNLVWAELVWDDIANRVWERAQRESDMADHFWRNNKEGDYNAMQWSY